MRRARFSVALYSVSVMLFNSSGVGILVAMPELYQKRTGIVLRDDQIWSRSPPVLPELVKVVCYCGGV
jgi:hypothetical protein